MKKELTQSITSGVHSRSAMKTYLFDGKGYLPLFFVLSILIEVYSFLKAWSNARESEDDYIHFP